MQKIKSSMFSRDNPGMTMIVTAVLDTSAMVPLIVTSCDGVMKAVMKRTRMANTGMPNMRENRNE